MESSRPPRLRRKSSAFKLSLSRASQASAYAHAVTTTPLPPPTPSADQTTQDFTFILAPSSSPESPFPELSPTTMNPLLPPPTTATTSTTSTTSTSTMSFPNVPSPSLTSTLDMLRQLVTKRITAWNYLKNASQGKVYWFNTVLLTKEELRGSFPNDKMRARTSRFTILSMSLSSMLEVSPAQDFLRGVLNLVQEFESVPEDKFAGLVNPPPDSVPTSGGNAVYSTSSTSVGGGVASLGGGVGGGGGASSVGVGGSVGGSIGGGGSRSGQKSLFKLTSSKSRSSNRSGISSGDQPNGQNSYTSGSGAGGGTGGGGGADFAFGDAGGENGYLFTPNIPFELDYFQVLTTTCELLIQVYTKILNYLGGGGPSTHTNYFPLDAMGKAGSTGSLSQGLAEVVVKIDSKLKKLIGLLSKEIDQLARTAIRNELEVLGGGVEGWGFEGLGGVGSAVTTGGE